ncbi:hypothetical protein RUM44_001558 [Polyplax serrata]|uniref:PABS domain-containing protein n=1 Tax=Polyplax serrata TaxID=468196 RepID=A0ABR1AKG2_POLSC
MNAITNGWFSEKNELWPGVSLSLEVKEILHSEKSQYQDLLVLDTVSKGKTLVLDGVIQCTENDEFSYQEMISFLPLNCHPNPKNVLIVGGGDGGVVREVAKHKLVKNITQVEIDGKVVEVSKKYLPFMAKGFNSEKLKLHIEDGFKFMKNHSNEFDVIITDSSDPIGPAVSLFEESYFSLIKKALKPNGIMCSQAGTPWSNLDIVKNTLQHVSNVFPVAAYGMCQVPTYPDGQIGFALGSLNAETNFKEPIHLFSDEDLDQMGLRYYTSDVHRSAFSLPRFAALALKSIIR